jgi:Na+-driven multidrug efflux pump
MIPEPSPEQQKEIKKILSKGRLSLVLIGLKYGVGLFLSNLAALLIGAQILKDVEPETIQYFIVAAMFVNFLFMASYLHRLLKRNNDIVMERIKEILKNNKT